MFTPTPRSYLRAQKSSWGDDWLQLLNPNGSIAGGIGPAGVGYGSLAGINQLVAGPGISIVGDVISAPNASSSLVLPSGVDVGTANAYVVNPTPAITLIQGASFTFTTNNANTGVSTINVSGTGVRPLRTILATPFTGGEIPGAGQIYQATYDGVEWILAGTLNAGGVANPAGTLNLAGAYVIPVAPTGANSGGLTFMSTGPSGVESFDRQMLNFIWVSTDGGNFNYNLSMGFDGDDIFLITGTIQYIAIEVPVETFRPFYINNQGTGDSLVFFQNNTPAPGAGAIVVEGPLTEPNSGVRMFVLSALTGLITTYNSIPTVSGGIPAEYATVDLAAQKAAISTTTLYTPVATGMFRISVYAKVTTPDGASSSLGGSTGLTIGYDDGSDSVAQTTVAQLATQAGAAAIINAGNTTATKLLGSVVIFALTGVPITYAFGYTSGTAATMAYEFHLKLEAL